MTVEIPPPTPPLSKRIKLFLLSSEKRNEAIRWRLGVLRVKSSQFFQRHYVRASNARKRRKFSREGKTRRSTFQAKAKSRRQETQKNTRKRQRDAQKAVRQKQHETRLKTAQTQRNYRKKMRENKSKARQLAFKQWWHNSLIAPFKRKQGQFASWRTKAKFQSETKSRRRETQKNTRKKQRNAQKTVQKKHQETRLIARENQRNYSKKIRENKNKARQLAFKQWRHNSLLTPIKRKRNQFASWRNKTKFHIDTKSNKSKVKMRNLKNNLAFQANNSTRRRKHRKVTSNKRMTKRVGQFLTSSEKRKESVRWRLEAMSINFKQFFKTRYIRFKKMLKRKEAQEQTILRLQEMLKEQERANAVQTTALQERVKVITEDFKTQKGKTVEARKETNIVKNLVKGDALEQLKITNRLLKTKTENLSDITRRMATVADHLLNSKSGNDKQFSKDNFITSALLDGYHKQSRYFLLDKLHQKDWEALLDFFTATNDGFDALEALRPMFTEWIQYYHGLIDVIEDRGYQIRPLDDYIDNGMQEKTVYIYHDVHAWDIIPALGMVLANKDREICTTFCLNIDQANVDVAHEAGYRIFGTLFGENAKLGLHCNPFASWIRMDLFKKDEQKFMEWFNSGNAENHLKAFLADDTENSGIFKDYTRKAAENNTYARLDKNFQKLKSFCPQARVANHHGDIVNQLYKDIRIKHSQTDSFLFVSSMLREKRAEDLGVLTSPTAVRRQNKPVGLIYGEIQNQSKYYENLHELLGHGVSHQLINHPGAISNGGLVMNLDFVRALGTGSFENYLPVEITSPTTVITSQTIIELAEDD